MDVRGMRHIRTARDFTAPARSGTQAQVVAELARHEHEKARLERELGIWAANQQATEGRLKRVLDRITGLRMQLDAAGRPRRTHPRRRRAPPAAARPRVVPIEY